MQVTSTLLPGDWAFSSMHTLPVGADGPLALNILLPPPTTSDRYAAENAPHRLVHTYPKCGPCPVTLSIAPCSATPLSREQLLMLSPSKFLLLYFFKLGLCLFQAVLFFVSKVILKFNLIEAMKIYFRKRYLGSLIYFKSRLKWPG